MKPQCNISETQARLKVVGKLNKTQLKEFEASGISEEYAQINFVNITRKYTERLLGVTDDISRRLKGTALLGGWADYTLGTFKPKQPRVSQGKIVKYEAIAAPRLIEVRHPETTTLQSGVIYVVEGFKKAVAVAHRSGCQTFAFSGLTIGIHLVEAINALKVEGVEVRLILDNDNSINAVDMARNLVRKLDPGIKIAKFKGFKGIDDAFMQGLTLQDIHWVDASKWIANYSGYQSGGDAYTFNAPRFHEIHVPENKTAVKITGAKGTGKTHGVEEYCKIHQDRVTINATHRRTLAIGNAARLGIPYIDHSDYKSGSVALCLNKILKVALDDCNGATFVIDEAVQVVDYLLHSSTLKHIRSQVFSHLSACLQKVRETQGKLFLMDADLDRKTENLLMALGGFTEKDVFSIRNTFIPDRGTAYFTHGMPIKFSLESTNPKLYPTNVVADIVRGALAGEKIWVCCGAQKPESKFGTVCLEQYLIDCGVPADSICRVDATTVGDPTHGAYRAASRLGEFTNEFRIYLVSPTLATGCDIQTYNFDKVYSLQGGAQRTDSARQAPERIRDSQPPRIVWAPEKVLWKKESGLTTPTLLESFRTAHNNALNTFDSSWFEGLEDTNRASIIQAVENWYLIDARERWDEKNNYAEKLIQGMQSDGYQIEEFSSNITIDESKDIYDALSAISDDFVNGERLQVHRRDGDVNEEQSKELFKSEQLTPEQRAGLKAYQIRNKLGIEPTVEVQAAIADSKDTQLENQFAATEGYELNQQIWQRDHYFKAGREGSQELTTDFVKRSYRMVRIKALRDVDFFNRILREFDSEDARQLLADLQATPLNITLFELPTSGGSHAVKTIGTIAKNFNFTVRQTRKIQGVRYYQAFDIGFTLSDSLDLKPRVFSHFTEKMQRNVDSWRNYKADYQRVKRGARLDEAKSLPALSDEFKYTKLSTRARTLEPLPVQPAVRMVTEENVAEFCDWLKSRLKLAIDIETYGEGKKGGLNHITGKIRLIQAATREAIWVVEESNFSLIKDAFKECLLNPQQRKIGHNFMFDLRFLRRDFGVLAHNCADTMLGSRCLMGDMGAAKITSHSLQQACENFLGVDVDKTEQKSDWGVKNLSQSQINYAARDPWLTFLLYERLEALTKDPSLLLLPFPKMMAWEAWEVENRFLFAAQQMEDTGYEIDVELLSETTAQYQAVRDELMSKWEAPYLPTQKAKLQKFLNDKYGLALSSLGKATAAENGTIPEIKLMQQICACDAILHQLSMIASQLKINSGRVKPYLTVLSGTGRTSSGATKIEKSLINLQSLAARVNPVLKDFNLPALKALFKTHLIIDLPASHGRISAELGNDANALAAYMDESIDMHCGTGAAVAQAVFPEENITAEWIQANKKSGKAKGIRDTAKNTYYGWLNGAGVATIQKQIKSNLQIIADKLACQRALEGLQNVFSGTTEFAKGKLKELEENQFVVNGIICGWMEFAGTFLCWRLGVVGGDVNVPATKAFAGIWSRTESLLMKRACYRIAEKFADMTQWESRLQNFIHDEINAEIGCKDAAEFAHAVVREEFGNICQRTIAGFDPIDKCYPLQNWSQK